MLSKEKRLNRRAFSALLDNKSYTKQGIFLSVRHIPITSKESKCAVVVSKNIAKTSVLRHFLRRRIYDAVQLVEGKSYIVYAKKGLNKKVLPEALKELPFLL